MTEFDTFSLSEFRCQTRRRRQNLYLVLINSPEGEKTRNNQRFGEASLEDKKGRNGKEKDNRETRGEGDLREEKKKREAKAANSLGAQEKRVERGEG